MPRAIDSAEETALRRMRESGATLGDMASALGVSERSVSRRLARLGLSGCEARARELFERGATKAEAASELGITFAQLTGVWGEMGLKRTQREGGLMRKAKSAGCSIADMGGAREHESPPREPRGGLFEPVRVEGDGPLARRYRQQLEERELCRKG